MAGLLSAAALSRHYREVVVVDRDPVLPITPEPRAGVSQGHHAHILLRRGLLGLELLLPGLTQQFLCAGAVLTNATNDWLSIFPGGPLPRFSSDLDIVTASRPLLEGVVRSYLMDNRANVSFIAGRKVICVNLFESSPPEVLVLGHGGATESMTADFVVDASGGAGNACRWLESSGFDAPEELSVSPHLGYSSAIFRGVKVPESARAAVVLAKDPDQPCGAVLLPIEDGAHIVTLYSFGSQPPRDPQGFSEFSKRLRSSIIHDAIANCTRIGPIRGYYKQQSIYRLFGRNKRWPNGFIVIGDAVCSFNPVYGQGMTAALTAAEVLERHFKHRSMDRHQSTQALQRAIVSKYKLPWLIATNEDLRWGTTIGERRGLQRTAHVASNVVVSASSSDPVVAYTYLSVLHMTKRPAALFSPFMLGRIVKSAFTRRRRVNA